MRVSLDIKIKQWKRHWKNTILCFPDKVKQFKEEVKRERKITPDDYDRSTFNCGPQVKILVFNPGSSNRSTGLGVDPGIRRGLQVLSTGTRIQEADTPGSAHTRCPSPLRASPYIFSF
ncbi:hypothetical protein Moror_3897 [Moniliophthora roreri MCA 2997]|uniref:Uncharacterized protein n=1 Tax=Moniliophthora roreri (strain MCA 2997) TaxID=1381753 RepID=V2XS03_MONRO|nr:hypothetical protein Moror_3897 [Moniliophthora roreri MCA 2997]